MIGPIVQPSRFSDVPSVITVVESEKRVEVAGMAAEKTEEVKVVEKVRPARMNVMAHFRRKVKFCGFSGSSSDSKVTMLGSWSWSVLAVLGPPFRLGRCPVRVEVERSMPFSRSRLDGER